MLLKIEKNGLSHNPWNVDAFYWESRLQAFYTQLFHQAKQHILKSNAFYILTPLIDVIYKLKK